jgi:hypothetical protein
VSYSAGTLTVDTGFANSAGTLSVRFKGTTAQDAAGKHRLGLEHGHAGDRQGRPDGGVGHDRRAEPDQRRDAHLHGDRSRRRSPASMPWTSRSGANPTDSSIQSVTGSGTSYTVTVATGPIDGDVVLVLLNDGAIKDSGQRPGERRSPPRSRSTRRRRP